ncbi:MAG: B12-binding domain-containing radical SAM protein [Clostridium sp.]
MNQNNEQYDVLLISPWSEKITVSPSFHIIRQEIELYSKGLYNKIFSEKNNRIDQAVKYYTKIPLSTGLLSIASVLRENGYKVKYISMDYFKSEDSNWVEKVLEQEMKNVRYMVGVTSVTPEIYRAIEILKLAKKLKPHITTVIGGPHVSTLDEIYAKDRSVDVVCRGEGEYTLLELMNAIKNRNDFKNIKGITYEKEGEVIKNIDRELLDLTQLPDAAYDLIPANEMNKFIYQTYFSRGCYNNCAYCVEGKYWGPKKRFRKVEKFVDELERFSKVFNLKYIHIFDSDFIQGNMYIDEICDELIKRDLDLVLSINTNPNLHRIIDENKLKKMIEAGFKEILIGSETAEDKLLGALNRRQTFEDLVTSTQLLKKVNMPIVSTYWVVGLPGETRESLIKTVEGIIYLFENNLIYHGSAKLFVPYPGTTVYENQEKYNINIISDNWEEFDRYNFPPPYIHNEISQLELYQYVNLIHSIQLSYFIKRVDGAKESYNNVKEYIERFFTKQIYL